MTLENCNYNPDTGIFTNSRGKVIGSYTRGYGRIFIRGKQIYLSRLAFFLMEGEWPTHDVDHINQNPLDNRWCNLRKCSRAQNVRNKSKYKTNQSGFKGVYSVKYKDSVYFKAKIQIDGKGIYLGTFNSAEEAALEYNKQATLHHGEYANLNNVKESN